MDKNKAMIDFLLGCEPIKKSPLYFNLSNSEAGSKIFVTQTEDKNMEEPYIDGSVKKRYSLTVISYCSISTNPLVKNKSKRNKNIEDYAEIQALIDWINVQETFPDFGSDFKIEKMYTTSQNPNIDQIDATVTPATAKYSFTVRLEYIDNSEVIWK